MTTDVTYKITQAAKPNPWDWDNCIAIFWHSGTDFSPVKSGTNIGLELHMCKGVGYSTKTTDGEYTVIGNAFGINRVSQFKVDYPVEVNNPNEVLIRLPKTVTYVRYSIDDQTFGCIASKYEYNEGAQYIPILHGKNTYDDNYSYWSINIEQWVS